MNFLKTKKPKLKVFFLKRTIQKKSYLSLNNSKENTPFAIERHSKQETNPSKTIKAKVAESNSKNVKQTVNRARTSLQNLYQIQEANTAKDV
jgi:hypothetical protein